MSQDEFARLKRSPKFKEAMRRPAFQRRRSETVSVELLDAAKKMMLRYKVAPLRCTECQKDLYVMRIPGKTQTTINVDGFIILRGGTHALEDWIRKHQKKPITCEEHL